MEWQIAKKIHRSLELLLRIAVASKVEMIPVSMKGTSDSKVQ